MKAMTLRLPDPLYEELRMEAFERRHSITQVILEAVAKREKARQPNSCDTCGQLPVVQITTPGGFRFCVEHVTTKALSCDRCGYTPVLMGDRHVDGGTLIAHMEATHTPHAAVIPVTGTEGEQS